jgi:hypothetical protein
VKTHSIEASHGVPENFLNKFGQKITGIISGFDRVRFRGTLRLLFQPSAMERYLASCGVLIKEFKDFAESITAKVKAAAYRAAAQAGRPAQYLRDPAVSKENYARQIAERDRIKAGLIALFSAVEPCYSYSVRGDRVSKEIHLVIEPRKCTHFYHYLMHAPVWAHARACTELVSIYCRDMPQWPGVACSADESGGHWLSAGW